MCSEKVKTDVQLGGKRGNLPDIKLQQLDSHALTEPLHGKLRGSVNIVEHHSLFKNKKNIRDRTNLCHPVTQYLVT